MRGNIIVAVAAIVGLSFGLGVGACSDRKPDQVCYERDAALDYEGSVTSLPYCSWSPGQFPDPPDGFEFRKKVFLSFKPSEGEPCDPCDLERFDVLLRDKIEEECDLPYELVRGCYVPAEETANGSCWVAGLYFSNCDPDA